MAKALFVTRHDISVFTSANGNIDNDKLLPFINQAQDIHIQNYLGTDLYNKIQGDITAIPQTLTGNYLNLVNVYIKPMLLHWSMVEYLPFAGVNIANGGVYTKNPENSTALSREDIEKLVERTRTTAQFYTNRFIDYMQNNAQSLFPEYYSNSQEDMYPDDVADFGGWVL